MADASTVVTIVALVVALIALLFPLLQLLQAIFGTADGGRQTNASVMGVWADMTRWKWNWFEFRFEVYFCSPHIELCSRDLKEVQLPGSAVPVELEGAESVFRKHLIGLGTLPAGIESQWMSTAVSQYPSTGLSAKSILSPALKYPLATDAMISWDHILAKTCVYQRCLFASGRPLSAYRQPILAWADGREQKDCSLFCLTLQYRSWDHAEVFKPFASITQRDLFILIRRLGMTWINFDPDNGIFEARDDRTTMTSRYAKSLGPIVTFKQHRKVSENYRIGALGADEVAEILETAYVPSVQMDKFAMSIIPCDGFLCEEDIRCAQSGLPSYNRIFSYLAVPSKLLDNALNVLWAEKLSIDLIGLISPFLPSPILCIWSVPQPFPFRPNRAYSDGGTLFRSGEGRCTLKAILASRCQTLESPTMHDIFEVMTRLVSICRADFCMAKEKSDSSKRLDRSDPRDFKLMQQAIDLEQEGFDMTSRYFIHRKHEYRHIRRQLWDAYGNFFRDRRPVVRPLDYTLLLHLFVVTYAESDHTSTAQDKSEIEELEDLNQKVRKELLGSGCDDGIIRFAWQLFRLIPEIHRRMTTMAPQDDLSIIEVEEAWWMLVLRGICWHLPIKFMPADTNVPNISSFYDSQAEVYIT